MCISRAVLYRLGSGCDFCLSPPLLHLHAIILINVVYFQMGHPANQRAAHVPAFASAHEQEESRPGDRARAVVLLS